MKGYKQTEVGVIPEDWNVMPLGNVANLDVGYAFKSSWFRDAGGIPLLRGENVGYGRLHWSEQRSLSDDMAKAFKEYLLRPGDIVVGMDRTFTKSGVKISLIKESDCPSLLVQRVGRFTARSCTNRFLWAVLRSRGFQNALQSEQKGMDIPHLSQFEILRPLVALPPTLAEQEAIASALSDADAWIESLEQLISKKRQIKQGAMQELLTGKRRLPGFSGKWETKRLGELGITVAGLTYAPRAVAESGTLVLRASNVVAGTLVFIDNVFVKTDLPERVFVKTGDILICVRNGSRDLIGKCAKIPQQSETDRHVFGAFMCVYRTDFHDFVFHQFQSNVIRRQITEHLGATINQITNKSLNSFEIPIPEIPEQTAIATVLTDMDTEIESLESKLAKAREIKQGMMQELLTGRIRLV